MGGCSMGSRPCIGTVASLLVVEQDQGAQSPSNCPSTRLRSHSLEGIRKEIAFFLGISIDIRYINQPRE
jgi:hypothetical protein